MAVPSCSTARSRTNVPEEPCAARDTNQEGMLTNPTHYHPERNEGSLHFSAGKNRTSQAILLNSNIHVTESILVSFTRLRRLLMRVVFDEVGRIPLLPRDHRMVRSSQRFLGANAVNPFVDGFFVGQAQLIKIRIAHRPRTLNATQTTVNRMARI